MVNSLTELSHFTCSKRQSKQFATTCGMKRLARSSWSNTKRSRRSESQLSEARYHWPRVSLPKSWPGGWPRCWPRPPGRRHYRSKWLIARIHDGDPGASGGVTCGLLLTTRSPADWPPIGMWTLQPTSVIKPSPT